MGETSSCRPSTRCTTTLEPAATGLANQALSSGDNLVAAGAQCDAHQKRCDRTERHADRDGCQQVHAHLGNRRIDQQQGSQRQKHDPSCGQHAVAGEFGFQSKQQERRSDERQGGEAHRQQVQREGSQQDEDDAYCPRDDCARVIELDVQREQPHREQDESDVGIHEVIEDPLLECHLE